MKHLVCRERVRERERARERERERERERAINEDREGGERESMRQHELKNNNQPDM